MQSGVAITANMTFAEAGVVNGDKIEVRQAGQGAGVPWDAIQLSIAYGVGTGAGLAVIKALGPIIQQIVKNRGTQSVEIEVAGKRIKIVGKNSISEAKTAIIELAQAYDLDDAVQFTEPRRDRSAKNNRARQRNLSPRKVAIEKHARKTTKKIVRKRKHSRLPS